MASRSSWLGVCNLATPPHLSQGQIKLRTSNLAGTFTWPIRLKPIKNSGENGAWAYLGTAQIFRVPPIISGTGKSTDFKFYRNIHSVDRNKTLENDGNSSRGRSQGVPKIFRAPMYRAQCAVIFAIAQLSCESKGQSSRWKLPIENLPLANCRNVACPVRLSFKTTLVWGSLKSISL